MRSFGRCEEARRDGEIVVRHRRARFAICNPKRAPVRVIEIDGCVITEGLRCDWLFLVAGDATEIYVELKGSHVDHAVRQIEATIPVVSEGAGTIPKLCYIVCRRVPKVGTRLQEAKDRFDRRYNAKLRVSTRQTVHDLAGAT